MRKWMSIVILALTIAPAHCQLQWILGPVVGNQLNRALTPGHKSAKPVDPVAGGIRFGVTRIEPVTSYAVQGGTVTAPVGQRLLVVYVSAQNTTDKPVTLKADAWMVGPGKIAYKAMTMDGFNGWDIRLDQMVLKPGDTTTVPVLFVVPRGWAARSVDFAVDKQTASVGI